MRKARFKETEIVRVLKEVEGGRQVKEACREYGISDATYYNWKARYGGMRIADVRKLKELAGENRRLKQMYADLSLKHEALKDIVEKRSEACGKARACRLCAAGTWHQPTRGV
jgi:putative transposase